MSLLFIPPNPLLLPFRATLYYIRILAPAFNLKYYTSKCVFSEISSHHLRSSEIFEEAFIDFIVPKAMLYSFFIIAINFQLKKS